METITIRVDETVFKQLEEKRGDKSKSDFYRDALSDYLNKKFDETESIEYLDRIKSQGEYIRQLKADLAQKIVENEINSNRIQDMQKHVGWMQLEYQKLSDRLLLPATERKKWWSFWK